MKRGQAAVEYVILTGLLLAFLVPIIQISLVQTSKEIRTSQLDDSFDRLSKAVDAVGALSIGAQEIVTITTPSGINTITLSDMAITVELDAEGGTQNIGYNTAIEITGTMPSTPGTYHLRVKKETSSLVNITLGSQS